MLFPLLSTACLMGGTFLLLTRGLLFGVQVVIETAENSAQEERA